LGGEAELSCVGKVGLLVLACEGEVRVSFDWDYWRVIASGDPKPYFGRLTSTIYMQQNPGLFLAAFGTNLALFLLDPNTTVSGIYP
jgi:hypothetical protein